MQNGKEGLFPFADFQMVYLKAVEITFYSWQSTLYLGEMGGVKVWKSFIGSGVEFDSLHPELIHIGKGCIITRGCCILSHFYSPEDSKFYLGEVHIGDRVFIGMNSLIVNAVRIGDDAVVGAGSVVTKDIPAGEVWAGNPAKFIKKRE